MDQDSLNQRLSRIATLWTEVDKAHHGPADAALAAQRRLMERYSGAAYRYLLAAVRDPDAADELAQEFALRFVRGDFRRADPEKGRFRDFVKTALYHLIVDHQKKQKRGRMHALPSEGWEPAESEKPDARDREFIESWRDELLARTWEALAEFERQTGQPYHAVLRFRADHPDLASPDLAERLSAQLNKPITAAGVRQTLHRARDKFADLLLEEVARSLENASAEQLEQELIDLGLLEHCKQALERRRR
jgi:RNA polymerase sigma-70 factor (ECF subfamily)